MTTVLPLNCSACGVAIDVQISNWTDSSTVSDQQPYKCPGCNVVQHVPGQITFIARRVETVFPKIAGARR